jgi:hypothetical protein
LHGQPVALKFARLGTERAEVSRSCVMWKRCVHILKWLLLHLIRDLGDEVLFVTSLLTGDLR